MDVLVNGSKDEVSERLKAVARAKVAHVGRLSAVLDHAEVRLAEVPDAPLASRQVCAVTMTGHGHVVRARAAASDPAVAVDLVVDKLERQAERLKGKLLARSHPRHQRPAGS